MYYQRLRDLREDKDLNQKDIAKILNITTQQYQLYESGKREIKVHQMVQLAEFYNVTMDYICGLTHIPRKLKKD